MRKRIRILEEGGVALDSVSLSPCAVTTEASLQKGRQLDFPSKVLTRGGIKDTVCLTDTGASASSFVDATFAKKNHLPHMALSQPCKLRLADDKLAPNITHMALVQHILGDHVEEIWCLVTKLGRFDIILGMPWLEQHNPTLELGDRTMTLKSDYCMSNCLRHSRPAVVHSVTPPLTKSSPPKSSTTEDIAEVSAYAFMRMAEKPTNEVIAMWPHDFEKLSASPKDDVLNQEQKKFTADLAAVTAEDYEKFFHKMRKKPLTPEQLRARVPQAYHKWLDVWNPVKANKLPPHRPIDHGIELKEGARPPAKRAYGLSRDQASVVKEYIEEMLGKDYIRPSTSPYAAPVLIVKKPDGGLRVCVDYRALNALTVPNRNAPPLIKETLAKLCAAKIYSKFDIIAAFNEIRVKRGDEHKTAFLTRYGLFEYNVMPFGLCNAPATFQAFINEVLREYLDVFCTAYLDDILIYSNTMHEHISHVGKVLSKLQEAGLYLDIDKCDFHVTRVKYLGLIITTDGVEMDQKKIDAIIQWKEPRCTRDVQAFLGFANFYRKFVSGYSLIAAPLTNLTRSQVKSNFIYPWAQGSPEQRSFEALKKAFTTAPVLAHFNPDRKTWLETDASNFVVAAVLSQEGPDGALRPVAFLSKKMSPAECNYDIYDKELMAIVRAFEEWRPELAGTAVEDPIQVISDHKNLQYFMTSKQLNSRQARWAEFLADFNFRITYRPGKQSTKPDSLTRRVGDLPEDENDDRTQFRHLTILKDENLDPGIKNAVRLASFLLDETEQEVTCLVSKVYDLSEQDGIDGEESEEESPSGVLVGVPEEESEEESTGTPADEEPELISQIEAACRDDELIQGIMQAKLTGLRKIPPELSKKNYLKLELADCQIHQNLLYVNNRLFVPDVPELRTRIIREIHETPPGGHAGRSSTYSRLSTHYYWPRMTDSVARYVKSCYDCLRSKSYREGKHGLLKPLPVPDRYWHDISIDFITHLPLCQRYGRSYEHIMVVVDRLSKKKKFIPLDSLEVDAVVQAFIEWVWREEGYPFSVISDRGTQFVAHFWKRLCQRVGTVPKLSTAFHPETDGQTESANAALKQYLRAYVNYNQDDWVDMLPIAEFEANSDINVSTGLSPFLVTKGYIPRSGVEPPTPLDPSATQRAKRDIKSADAFVEKIDKMRDYLRDQLKWSQALQKEQADRHRLPAPEFKVGDMVMLDRRNIKTVRPNKSLDHKNLGPYRVTKALGNMAYEVDLPQSLKIHPVFHPWLLHLDKSDPLPGQHIPPPPPVETDEDGDIYDVAEILDSKIDGRRKDPVTNEKGCLLYKIKWTGYKDDKDGITWEDFTSAAGCADLVADFHHSQPEKPGPHRSFKRPSEWAPLLMTLTFDGSTDTQKSTWSVSEY